MFVAEQIIKQMIQSRFPVKNQQVIVLGMTFKEDVPDLRNSKLIDVVRELQACGAQVYIHDPIASTAEAEHEYGVRLIPCEELPKSAAIVTAVSHRLYREMGLEALCMKLQPGGVFSDVKSSYDAADLRSRGISVWRL